MASFYAPIIKAIGLAPVLYGIWRKEISLATGRAEMDGRSKSPVKVTTEQLFAAVDPRAGEARWCVRKAENIEKRDPEFLYEVKRKIPELKLPAVWLPHGVGHSNSEIITDDTQNKFGLSAVNFCGRSRPKQNNARGVGESERPIPRCGFRFQAGFSIRRVAHELGHDGTLFVGETNRGGARPEQPILVCNALTWTGKTPWKWKP